MKETVEVTDLFRGAFLLCVGGRLEKVNICDTGRRIASFFIIGKNLVEMDGRYRTGQALVNPVQLREALNHLRDVMFEKLRTHEQTEKRGNNTNGRQSNYRTGKAY